MYFVTTDIDTTSSVYIYSLNAMYSHELMICGWCLEYLNYRLLILIILQIRDLGHRSDSIPYHKIMDTVFINYTVSMKLNTIVMHYFVDA